MKIGGMGVQFLNKKGVAVESLLYTSVVGWRYSRSDKQLRIDVGQGSRVERALDMGTDDGEEIGMLMRDHAVVVAKQLKAEKQQKAEAEARALEQSVGRYRIQSPVTCRDGAELDSHSAWTLQPGDIVEVTEATVNSRGVTRLRCAHGWFSRKLHLCVKLDADGATPRLPARLCAATLTLTWPAFAQRQPDLASQA